MNNLKKTWSLVIALAFTLFISVPFTSCENPASQDENEENIEEAAVVETPANSEVEGEEHPESNDSEHPEGNDSEHPEGSDSGHPESDEETANDDSEHPEGEDSEHPDN